MNQFNYAANSDFSLFIRRLLCPYFYSLAEFEAFLQWLIERITNWFSHADTWIPYVRLYETKEMSVVEKSHSGHAHVILSGNVWNRKQAKK